MISARSDCTTPLCLLLVAAVSLVLGASSGASVQERLSKSNRMSEKLSQRLCDALQSLPETRKAQCCGTSPSGGLAGACARELRRSLGDDAVTLDPAAVDRCAAESSRELKGCDWVTPYLPRVPASCRGIVHGRLEAGARCRSSLECRDGLHCLGSGPTVPGLCAPPSVPGAACGGAPDTLATYARQSDSDTGHPECAGFCLRGRCVGFAPPGGACSSDRHCAPGSHCASRRCVEGPSPALGEPCGGSTCASDLACIDGRCSEAKKAGELCTHPFECQAACLSPAADKPGTCGMKCSTWPPAGYTPPVDGPVAAGATPRRRDTPRDRRPAK